MAQNGEPVMRRYVASSSTPRSFMSGPPRNAHTNFSVLLLLRFHMLLAMLSLPSIPLLNCTAVASIGSYPVLALALHDSLHRGFPIRLQGAKNSLPLHDSLVDPASAVACSSLTACCQILTIGPLPSEGSIVCYHHANSSVYRKLVIIGDGACGKTSLLSVFTLGYFPTVCYPAAPE
jgi:hypothetical protein